MPATDPHIDVMISSTTKDLKDYRAKANEVVLHLKAYPLSLEYDEATPHQTPYEYSMSLVEKAEIYVGIFAHRYGFRPKDQPGGTLSMTELEYRRAMERGLPVLIFIMEEAHPFPKNLMDEGEDAAAIKALKAELGEKHVVSFFGSPEDFAAKFTAALSKVLADLRGSAPKDDTLPPQPPQPYYNPRYMADPHFIGRTAELKLIDDWAASPDPVMIVDAIGGMGKSALTWQWLHTRGLNLGYEGVFWWSFYESGATLNACLRHLLAYAQHRDPHADDLKKMPYAERAAGVLEILNRQPYLLILDGAERLLVAYHRLTPAHLKDEAAEAPSPDQEDTRACITQEDGDFLRRLAAVGRGKILMSSRLLPTALCELHERDRPLGGVRRKTLNGLTLPDALSLAAARGVEVKNQAAFRDFLAKFGYHSLLLKIIIGMVKAKPRYQNQFDRWHQRVGGSFKLSEVDLRENRNHILAAALQDLSAQARKLLSQLAAFRDAVDYDTAAIFNPFGEDEAGLDQFDRLLLDLEARGLIHREGVKYDFHPVVRAYAFEQLEDAPATFDRIGDYFSSKQGEDAERPKELTDLSNTLEVFRALMGAGRREQAADFYRYNLSNPLDYNVAAYPAILELLKPFFVDGLDQPPPGLRYRLQSYLVTDLAAAFAYLGQAAPALGLKSLGIRLDLEAEEMGELAVGLLNYAISLADDNQAAAALAARHLAMEVARAAGNANHEAWAWLQLLVSYVDLGDWAAAEAAYQAFMARPPITQRDFWRGVAEQTYAWGLFYQGLPLAENLARAQAWAEASDDAFGLRELEALRGELELRDGEPAAAAERFAKAIAMARKSGISTLAGHLAGLARARLAQGQAEAARHLCEEALRLPNPYLRGLHQALAEVYQGLGEAALARDYALKAYTWAWADGEPYVNRYWLDRARALLLQLGEVPPSLPPYDPAKIRPIPHEAGIRALIAKREAAKAERERLRAEREKKDSAG
jgi:tetratricopeptide (TPR) repeat protein